VFVVFRETLSKRDKTFLLSMKVSGETCVCVYTQLYIIILLTLFLHYGVCNLLLSKRVH